MAEVIVIGAGAAGLLSAVTAARNGKQVTVIEACAKAGKKIYATGNGRCNFTNLHFDADSFRGTCPEFAYRAYEKFNNLDVIEFFEQLGVLHKEINGYIYPNSEQASCVVEALLAELHRLSVQLVLNEQILDIQKRNKEFLCIGQTQTYTAAQVIIAAGGLASPKHGSNGSIFPACKRLGHSFIPQMPALVNLKFKEKALAKLAGVRVRGCVYLYFNGIPAYQETGEIIFNKDNISGIPVMQLSRYCGHAIAQGKKASLHIDLFENISDCEIRDLLTARFYGAYSKGKTVYETLIGFLNNKLLDFLLKQAGVNPNKKAMQVKPAEVNAIIGQFKNFEINITDTGSFENAQVTAGGIKTDEVKDTMESKLVKGLYFAGEILDIDGTCGGYNLQWAFTSGYIAGHLQ